MEMVVKRGLAPAATNRGQPPLTERAETVPDLSVLRLVPVPCFTCRKEACRVSFA